MRSSQAAKWLAVVLAVALSGASDVAGADDATAPEAPSDAERDPSDDEAAKESDEQDPSDDEVAKESDEQDPSDDEVAKEQPDEKDPSDDEVATEGDEEDPSDDAVAEDPDDDDAGEDEFEDNPPIAREDEPLVLLETDRLLRIKARRARLRESAYQRLRAIAKKYREVTDRKLVVTGGGRKPARQAELMHDMMRDGKDLLRLYKQVGLVKPLIAAFERGREKRWGRRRTVALMTRIIDDQVKAGKFVSRHLAHTAADVRSRGLKDEHVEALKQAVSEVKGARLVDERNGNAPHFHLSL